MNGCNRIRRNRHRPPNGWRRSIGISRRSIARCSSSARGDSHRLSIGISRRAGRQQWRAPQLPALAIRIRVGSRRSESQMHTRLRSARMRQANGPGLNAACRTLTVRARPCAPARLASVWNMNRRHCGHLPRPPRRQSESGPRSRPQPLPPSPRAGRKHGNVISTSRTCAGTERLKLV